MMTVSAMRALSLAIDDQAVAEAEPRLSTDYLNRYGEALMLLEMAQMDPGILADLHAWRPVGYRAHFEASQLRCRDVAIAAYDGLTPQRRIAFEELCGTMDGLIAAATACLSDLPDDEDCSAFVQVTSETMRTLIGRATQFINANGAVGVAAGDPGKLQDEIDALFGS